MPFTPTMVLAPPSSYKLSLSPLFSSSTQSSVC
ncbi:hypothetical protein LINPERHAP1_LOCUS360 [Linum perenne]